MTETPCPDVVVFVVTNHAREQMRRRGVAEPTVAAVLKGPAQRMLVRVGRCVYQLIITDEQGRRPRLLRVFVDVDRDPPEVVTVYLTSRIDKYWRGT